MLKALCQRLETGDEGRFQASLLDLFCSYMEDVTVYHLKLLDTG